MKPKNIIQEKSYAFALKIILLANNLKEYAHYELSSQIIRAGTSIGANIEEAIGGQSRRDFVAKLSISYKEARESHYWLRLIRDSKIYPKTEVDNLINDCEEIIKIITAILNRTKANGI